MSEASEEEFKRVSSFSKKDEVRETGKESAMLDAKAIAIMTYKGDLQDREELKSEGSKQSMACANKKLIHKDMEEQVETKGRKLERK